MTAIEAVNIASALTDAARARPYAAAVVCPAGRDRANRPRYTQWTFRQLDRESDLLARGLTTVGIGRGVRTVLMVRPSLEFFALAFALFKAGAVPVFIDPGMGLGNLGKCLKDACPGAFIGIPRALVARRLFGWAKSVRIVVKVEPADPEAPSPPLPRPRPKKRSRPPNLDRSLVETVFDPGLPDPQLEASLTLAQVRGAGLDGGDAAFPIASPRPDEMAAILFTSGSTGPPKGVVYTHPNFSAQVEILRDLYGIEPGEVDLCTFPLFALFAPALGMTSIVPEMDSSRPARVDARKIIEAVENFGATNLFGSPALLERVGEYGCRRGLALPTLRRVISAGAPVPARVLERFATMLAPGVQIFTPYGATEALPVCSIGSDEILGETRHATDRGAGVCVGRPAPAMRVEIIRATDETISVWRDDLIIPDGEIGEIAVRGPVVTNRYFGRDDATLAAKISGAPPEELKNDEYTHFDISGEFLVAGDLHGGRGVAEPVTHRMGDLGYRDSQGRIWFCGRKAHVVRTATGPLYTIPCEAVFNTHPDVSRSALVGVGAPGEARPVLCVEPKDWKRSRREGDRLRGELRALASSHPHTCTIDTFLFHQSFPVDVRHNAKIFREKLAVWAARRVRMR